MISTQKTNPTKHTLPIIVDQTTRIISVGKWIADDIYYNKPVNEGYINLKSVILARNNISIKAPIGHAKGNGLADYHAEISRYLGARFYAQLRKVSTDVWINPIRDILNKYCLYTKSRGTAAYDPHQVRRAWEMLPLIHEMEKQALQHLVPLGIYFCLPIDQFQRTLGASLWNDLCQTSLSRVHSLVFHLLALDQYANDVESNRTKPLSETAAQRRIERITFWSTLKSSMLRLHLAEINHEHYSNLDIEVSENSCEEYSSPYYDKLITWLNDNATPSNTVKYEQIKYMVDETERASRLVGLSFSFGSLSEMEKQHKESLQAAREKVKARYMAHDPDFNEPFDGIEIFQQNLPVIDGVKITLLSSTRDMVNESIDMRNDLCDFVDGGRKLWFVAFSLQSHQQRSTLSFGLTESKDNSGSGSYRIYAHHSSDHSDVTCPQLISAAEAVLYSVNTSYDKHLSTIRSTSKDKAGVERVNEQAIQ